MLKDRSLIETVVLSAGTSYASDLDQSKLKKDGKEMKLCNVATQLHLWRSSCTSCCFQFYRYLLSSSWSCASPRWLCAISVSFLLDEAVMRIKAKYLVSAPQFLTTMKYFSYHDGSSSISTSYGWAFSTMSM